MRGGGGKERRGWTTMFALATPLHGSPPNLGIGPKPWGARGLPTVPPEAPMVGVGISLRGSLKKSCTKSATGLRRRRPPFACVRLSPASFFPKLPTRLFTPATANLLPIAKLLLTLRLVVHGSGGAAPGLLEPWGRQTRLVSRTALERLAFAWGAALLAGVPVAPFGQ